MIRLVESAADAARFSLALAGRADPVSVQTAARFAAFRDVPGSGWKFYTGGEEDAPLALSVRGSSAQLSGSADGEELAGLLALLGVARLKSAEAAAPAGWRQDAAFAAFYAPASLVAPALPAGAVLDEDVPMSEVMALLTGGDSLAGEAGKAAAENFYAEGCALRNRGLAKVWGLRLGGELAATAGLYAIGENAAMLGGVETARAFRRRGCAAALVCRLAALALPKGPVCLLARHGAEGFYQRLGFEQRGTACGFAAPEND